MLYFKWYDIIIYQFCISYAAVVKCTCRWQSFPNCCATGKCDNRTTQWVKQLKLSTHQKWINKENSRSEIWRTDLTAPVCKHCYRPKSCFHRNASNLFKHLSLAHPDLFRELRDRQGECIIYKFRFNLNFYLQLLFTTFIYSKPQRACDTLEPVKFWSLNMHWHFIKSNNNWIWIFE